MAKRGKIERAGVEADVLEMAKKGLGSRAIAKELAKRGLRISHTAVSRFLSEETADRERARRATTAAKAAEIAGKAGEDADDNLGRLRELLGPLATMAVRAVRRVSFPDEAEVLVPARDASADDAAEQASRFEDGQREWWEPVAAKDQIRAAAVTKDVLTYLVELAGANPRPTDPKNLDAIRAAIAEVFGYAVEPRPESEQEAPLTPEEHQPPVMH